jgi:hypothetical protein
VLAAGRIRTDGTGFHVCGTVKGCLNAVPLCFSKHLGRGITYRGCSDIKAFLFSFLFDLLSFFFLHHFSSFMVFLYAPSWRLVTIPDKKKI